MNSKIDTALHDIDIIKGTLEDTKVHYRAMYLMCFLMAAVNGIKYIWLLLEVRFMPSMVTGVFVGVYICPLILMIGYLYIYRNEKKYSNKYYLSMIGIWGFMASVIPAMKAVVNMIGAFLRADQVYDSAPLLRGSDFIDTITNIILFSVFLIICAYILDKRIFMILAVLSLFCFMILEKFFTSEGIPFRVGNQTQTRLVYSSVYSIIVDSLGYMALGLYLRRKQKEQEI